MPCSIRARLRRAAGAARLNDAPRKPRVPGRKAARPPRAVAVQARGRKRWAPSPKQDRAPRAAFRALRALLRFTNNGPCCGRRTWRGPGCSRSLGASSGRRPLRPQGIGRTAAGPMAAPRHTGRNLRCYAALAGRVTGRRGVWRKTAMVLRFKQGPHAAHRETDLRPAARPLSLRCVGLAALALPGGAAMGVRPPHRAARRGSGPTALCPRRACRFYRSFAVSSPPPLHRLTSKPHSRRAPA